MAREKRGKARADFSPEIESPPSSDFEETHDATSVRAQHKRKVVASKLPREHKVEEDPHLKDSPGLT